METKIEKIPFGKAARIGNFKIWRSKYTLPGHVEDNNGVKPSKKQKMVIECINVSVLDGSFSVRIPQTFEMFAMLSLAYQWLHSGDKEERERGETFLRMAVPNMFYVSSICNGFFHHAVEMVTNAYANPSLLCDNEDGKSFIDETRETVDGFLSWHKEYEKYVSENEPTEQDIRQDELADEATKILS